MTDKSGTPYGRVIADGQSTVTFASGLVELVRQPLSALWSKHSAVADYRVALGEWATEAVDTSGRWMQPVLRTKAFEDHLISEGGRPKPSGSFHSSLAWAQLLYALNIRPGARVLAWRLPSRAVFPEVEAVRLKVEGGAMCHIINLFRIYKDAAPKNFSQDGYRVWSDPTATLPFGTIQILPADGLCDASFIAKFVPGPREDLGLERLPFSCDHGFLRGRDHLKLESTSLMAKYFNGLYNQVPITDTAGIGPLPAPGDPLKKRAQYYVQSTDVGMGHGAYKDTRRTMKQSGGTHVCVCLKPLQKHVCFETSGSIVSPG